MRPTDATATAPRTTTDPPPVTNFDAGGGRRHGPPVPRYDEVPLPALLPAAYETPKRLLAKSKLRMAADAEAVRLRSRIPGRPKSPDDVHSVVMVDADGKMIVTTTGDGVKARSRLRATECSATWAADIWFGHDWNYVEKCYSGSGTLKVRCPGPPDGLPDGRQCDRMVPPNNFTRGVCDDCAADLLAEPQTAEDRWTLRQIATAGPTVLVDDELPVEDEQVIAHALYVYNRTVAYNPAGEKAARRLFNLATGTPRQRAFAKRKMDALRGLWK